MTAFTRKAVVRYILAENVSGRRVQIRPHAAECPCGCTATSDRASICSYFGVEYHHWYKLWRQQRSDPYVFQQDDADDGLIDVELVGLPSVVIGGAPDDGWTLAVARTPEEVIDFVMSTLQGSRTHTRLLGTGITAPMVKTLAGLSSPRVARSANRVHDLVGQLSKAFSELYSDAAAARAEIDERRKVEVARARVKAAAAKLGVTVDLD